MRTLSLLLALCACGCAVQDVHPWQRGDLARPEMALQTDTLETAVREHTYVSKEAASGGAALPGGGCGCN